MHGMGQGIRQMMAYAKPWQRYVLCAAIMALGAVLVALGHVRGVILVVLGALFVIETARRRISMRRGRTGSTDPPSAD